MRNGHNMSRRSGNRCEKGEKSCVWLADVRQGKGLEFFVLTQLLSAAWLSVACLFAALTCMTTHNWQRLTSRGDAGLRKLDWDQKTGWSRGLSPEAQQLTFCWWSIPSWPTMRLDRHVKVGLEVLLYVPVVGQWLL